MITLKAPISDPPQRSLSSSARTLLLDLLEDHRTRVLARKASRLYIGYWGRSLYFFLGVQVTFTAIVVMANRMLP
ncbi:MAG: hypothetical protein P1S59_14250 [bacterium]|nr:hypothetical protein [bacterium]